MESKEALENLATIRKIMESATQLTVMPGAAAIAGGVLALIGCVGTYFAMRSVDFAQMAQMTTNKQLGLIGMWVGLGILAVVIDIAVSVRLAKKQDSNPWTRLGELTAYIMAPAFLAALIISIALWQRGEWRMAPAIWMMLYGVAIWMTSILSLRAPKVLGLAFFLAGVVTLFWAAPIGLIMVGCTFGLGHILLGAYLLARFGT